MTRRVLVAGATGLVGRALVERLIADRTVAAVHVVGRRPAPVSHPKVTSLISDLVGIPPLPDLDEVYLAVGTTIRTAGSQAAFRAVDFDANLAVARAALAAGARRAGLVSAMGADAASRVFYNRVKGELEDALALLPFIGQIVARPSLLVGNRAALGQPARPLEKVATVASRLFTPLVPANYRPIAASDVARALVSRVPTAEGRVVLLSAQMRR